MKRCSLSTSSRLEFVDITDEVRDAVARAKVKSGLCVVYCPHTTAAITINENADPDVPRDMALALKRIVPKDWPFAHGEGNSDSHIQTALYGPSQTLILEDGELQLGRWQGIFFCEFDGPRQRTFLIKIVGENG